MDGTRPSRNTLDVGPELAEEVLIRELFVLERYVAGRAVGLGA
jgi:hypothetical protein